MARRLFEAALGNRLMTISLVVIFVALGVRAMVALPIDASPDVTPNVVTIVTEAPGLGPVEVEKLITFPIEVTMRGLPGIKEIRSISRFGLSSVSVYFRGAARHLFCSSPCDGAAPVGGHRDDPGQVMRYARR